jgi:hypothetical protein
MKKAYFNNKKETKLTRVSNSSHSALKALAEKRGLRMVTVLEYILRGDISIEELNYAE